MVVEVLAKARWVAAVALVAAGDVGGVGGGCCAGGGDQDVGAVVVCVCAGGGGGGGAGGGAGGGGIGFACFALGGLCFFRCCSSSSSSSLSQQMGLFFVPSVCFFAVVASLCGAASSSMHIGSSGCVPSMHVVVAWGVEVDAPFAFCTLNWLPYEVRCSDPSWAWSVSCNRGLKVCIHAPTVITPSFWMRVFWPPRPR